MVDWHTKFKDPMRRSLGQFRNQRPDMPCILLGLAPHLDDIDLDVLDGLCSIFVCNRFWRCFESPDRPFEPTYYVCSDRRVWRRESELVLKENVIMMLGDVIFDKKCPLHEWLPGLPKDPAGQGACPPPGVPWYGYRTIHKTDNVKFSEDPDTGLWQAGTVAYDMLQIAAYMGFNPIGILGVELQWPKNENAPTHACGMDGRKHGAFKLYTEYNLKYFGYAAGILKRRGVEVFNLAPKGVGALDVFPRIPLTAFADKCNV